MRQLKTQSEIGVGTFLVCVEKNAKDLRYNRVYRVTNTKDGGKYVTLDAGLVLPDNNIDHLSNVWLTVKDRFVLAGDSRVKQSVTFIVKERGYNQKPCFPLTPTGLQQDRSKKPSGGARVSVIVSPNGQYRGCLLYTSPSPRDGLLSRMPSSA